MPLDVRRPTATRNLRWWLGYAGAWTLLGLTYAALFASSGMPLASSLRGAFASVLPNAFFGPLSLGLARRRGLSEGGRGRNVVSLVLAILLLDVLSTAGWLGLIALENALTPGPARWPSLPIAAWQIVLNGMIHATLAGLGYARHAAEAVREAQERAARAEVLRARAELHLLRSQLQPHFVLNTLHALLGLVRRDPSLAEGALERLGDLLKFGQWVHQTNADFVPLSREWEFVRSYLDLERLRLGDRLHVSLSAEDAALEVPIPPFAIQPLVENAILHAIAPRAAGGRIGVSARRSGGKVSVAVEDDGPGASEAQIAASPRMGLRLLRERLAAIYAGKARLFFESPAGGGFRARLEMPDDAASEVA